MEVSTVMKKNVTDAWEALGLRKGEQRAESREQKLRSIDEGCCELVRRHAPPLVRVAKLCEHGVTK
jgi:hypothetical protein